MHINRKPTKYDENVTSLKCENCGEEFRNAGEFKEHMIWRSYQQLKFKGYECDSWGSKKQTIEMHIRRIHSETVACGMCEFEGKGWNPYGKVSIQDAFSQMECKSNNYDFSYMIGW